MESVADNIPFQLHSFLQNNTSSNSTSDMFLNATSGRAIRGNSVQLEVWVPALVLSHVFAIYWLLKALTLFQPGAWRHLRQTLNRFAGRQTQLNSSTRNTGSTDSTGNTTSSWDALADLEENPLGSHKTLQQAPELQSSDIRMNRCLKNSSTLAPNVREEKTHWLSLDVESQSNAGDKGATRGTTGDVVSSTSLAGRSSCKEASAAGHCLEWRGLGCCYETPTGSKVVLEEVWGRARPGEMQVRITQITGSSGLCSNTNWGLWPLLS
jgi:hypothetical protein